MKFRAGGETRRCLAAPLHYGRTFACVMEAGCPLLQRRAGGSLEENVSPFGQAGRAERGRGGQGRGAGAAGSVTSALGSGSF